MLQNKHIIPGYTLSPLPFGAIMDLGAALEAAANDLRAGCTIGKIASHGDVIVAATSASLKRKHPDMTPSAARALLDEYITLQSYAALVACLVGLVGMTEAADPASEAPPLGELAGTT